MFGVLTTGLLTACLSLSLTLLCFVDEKLIHTPLAVFISLDVGAAAQFITPAEVLSTHLDVPRTTSLIRPHLHPVSAMNRYVPQVKQMEEKYAPARAKLLTGFEPSVRCCTHLPLTRSAPIEAFRGWKFLGGGGPEVDGGSIAVR